MQVTQLPLSCWVRTSRWTPRVCDVTSPPGAFLHPRCENSAPGGCFLSHGSTCHIYIWMNTPSKVKLEVIISITYVRWPRRTWQASHIEQSRTSPLPRELHQPHHLQPPRCVSFDGETRVFSFSLIYILHVLVSIYFHFLDFTKPVSNSLHISQLNCRWMCEKYTKWPKKNLFL